MIMALFRPERHQANIVPLRPATASLPGLPTELIEHIASYLRPCYIACLTLTCKRLVHVLGTTSWSSLLNSAECAIFLHTLEGRTLSWVTALQSDLPQQSGSERYNLEHAPTTVRATLLAGSRTPLFKVFGFSVGWLHALLAYKQYPTGGSYNISLDEFSHEAYRAIPMFYEYAIGDSERRTRHVKLAVTPRIVAGFVLLKCTYTTIFTPDDKTLRFRDIIGMKFGVCNHVHLVHDRKPWNDTTLIKALSRAEDYREVTSQVSSTTTPTHALQADPSYDDILGPVPNVDQISLRQCTFCATEFEARIERRDADMSGAIVLTAWTNLGCVKAPSSADFEENNQLWEAFTGKMEEHDVKVHYYPLGSVKDSFERWDGSRLGDVRYING